MSRPDELAALVGEMRQLLMTIGQVEIAESDPRREHIQAAFDSLADLIERAERLAASPASAVPMRQVGEVWFQRRVLQPVDQVIAGE